MLISPKPCEIERFRRNFRPTGYLKNVLFAIFAVLILSLPNLACRFIGLIACMGLVMITL